MQLSDEEREHIRLAEEYRAEVRAKLAEPAPAPREAWWRDKLAVPLVIVVVSGLLAPWVLGKIDDHRRAFELQSRLIEQIVGDDAAAQVNAYEQNTLLAEKNLNRLRFLLEKRVLAVRTLDPAERQTQRVEIHEEYVRQSARLNAAADASLVNTYKFVVEHRGNIEWVKLHYGTPAQLQAYEQATDHVYGKALREITEFTGKAETIASKAALALRSCPDEQACQKIYDDAETEVDKLRQRMPDFAAWDEARRQLVKFISETDPRM